MKRISVNFHTLRRKVLSVIGVAMMFSTVGVGGIGQSLTHAQLIRPTPNPVPIPATQVLYSAKFVCGFKPGFTPPQGNVVNGPGIFNYRDFEPGSYATALNVLYATGRNTNTNVNVFVSVPETTQNSALTRVNLGPLPLSNFGTVKVDCGDIAQALNGPLPQIAAQEVIEGFLYITRGIDDLVVEAVYSYSSQIGALGGELGSELGGNGGIGLGASVHVQNIEPKTLNNIRLFRQ